MKYDARNALKGTIKELTSGMVNTEVVVEVAPGVEVVSVTTWQSSQIHNTEIGVWGALRAPQTPISA